MVTININKSQTSYAQYSYGEIRPADVKPNTADTKYSFDKPDDPFEGAYGPEKYDKIWEERNQRKAYNY